jgi:heme exporter protein D
MNGTITGGWGFVVAAYTISAAMLVGYAFHAIASLRRALRERHGER